MELSGSMIVLLSKPRINEKHEEYEETVLGSEFGLEECESENLGDNDRATWYIYKYFGSGYETTFNLTTINGQVQSYDGPHITDLDDDTEAEITYSSISP